MPTSRRWRINWRAGLPGWKRDSTELGTNTLTETSMNFWQEQRVIVTGGAGFLGSFVVAGLKARGCTSIFTPRSRDYNLLDRAAIARLFQETQPTMVLHLAAVVGGIGANREHPGKF